MTRDALLLGVDVGGTTTAAGAVTREGAVLVEQRVLTHRDGKGRAPETIIELLGSVREQAERRGHAVEAIGVGVPGPVDPTVGRIGEHVPHVPELAGRALAAELAERFGRPAFVDNDVNALALGEWMFGAGRGTRSLVVLAPGTGFGAGIVLESRLVRGAAGVAASPFTRAAGESPRRRGRASPGCRTRRCSRRRAATRARSRRRSSSGRRGRATRWRPRSSTRRAAPSARCSARS